ncbi:DNA primase [Sphingomonas koreensis]|uniref:DNA primase n=1 Tax=Sphingomonas koreensis TaxID=93064 RepID=A0A1L6JFY4_9SPHN|nr:DNA primase [Sphingomonas koreensis]
MEEAAINFARRGWPVFPCNPKNKRPLLGKDKDPVTGEPIKGSGGVTKATTDEKTIRTWWRKWPKAMIGVSVGQAGMLVVDFDPRIDEEVDKETGEVTTREWTLDDLKFALAQKMGCPLPATLAVSTPSGGEHHYFQMPAGEPIGNRGNLPKHIDVRGQGGYVIVPPSICSGDGSNTPGPYRWLGDDPATPIAAMPLALESLLRSSPERDKALPSPEPVEREKFTVDLDSAHRSYALRALDEELRELAATPKGGGRYGGRNQGAYSAAFNLGQLVGAGALPESMVRAALLDTVRAFDPSAYDRHVAAIENGLTNGMAKPRDLSAIGTRGGSGRPSSPPRASAPVEAYADDAERWQRGATVDDEVDADAAFQSGNVAEDPIYSGGRGRIDAEPDDELDRMCATFPLTDLGNAERFRARHGWRFRFCNELGWFIWDGRRWALLSEEKDKVPGPVSLAVFATVRAIRNEADFVSASGLREERADDPEAMDFIAGWRGSGDNREPVLYSELLAKHATASEGNGRLGCIANLAKAFGELAIRADAMDRDRMAINVLNGTLRFDLRGNRVVMRLDPHRPEDLISKIANVAYDPDATCEEYDGFLERVQPDGKMRRFLHQWGGLSLTGDIGEQKLAFYHGKGRNGKSTMVDAWAHVAGDYGGSVGIETFLDQGRGRKGGDATPDLARLPGIRFLRTSEPEKGAKLAEALIKLITGGEEITARHLNKGFFTFLPSFKVTVSGNHKPKITGHDDGIWRRVMLVPWDVQIPADEVDKKLPEKLKAEASGLLNRLLEGLVDWRENGLIEPDTVKAATAKYREQSDQLGRFLSECTRDQSGARSKSSVLFKLFNAWVKANGAAEWQQVGFTKAMEDRGYETMRSNGMQWLDLEMVKTVEDYADAIRTPDEDHGDDHRPAYPDDDLDPL